MRSALLALIILSSCAHLPGLSRDATPAPPDTDGILQLIGRYSAAHACPVSEHLALTSAHVTDLRPFDRDMPLFPYQWGALEADGLLLPVMVWQHRDLSLMRSEAPFPRWYHVAPERPKPGEKLWLTEYDFKAAARAFVERKREVRVTRIVARSVTYIEGGEQGSSGSCLLNAAAEVVAVNSWRIESGANGPASGLAVGVWGETFNEPVKP